MFSGFGIPAVGISSDRTGVELITALAASACFIAKAHSLLHPDTLILGIHALPPGSLTKLDLELSS